MIAVFLNVADIRLCTGAEGPGKRCAVWLQGCKKSCKGCCNPEMQPFIAKHIVEVDSLFRLVLDAKQKYNIEGISLIGGEPFLQAQGLSLLAQKCSESNLSVVVFSGYTIGELRSSQISGAEDLLKYTDILIDGEYIENLPDTNRGWVGSTNQHVLFLSNRYSPGIEFSNSNLVEVLINDDTIYVNGSPAFEI